MDNQVREDFTQNLKVSITYLFGQIVQRKNI